MTTWAFPVNEAICAFLQAQWRENLGLETTWESLEGMAVYEKWARQPPYIFPLYPLATYPDPSSLLTKNLAPRGSHWKSKTYERLIAQAEQTMDQEERLHLYRQADRLLVEEAICLPLSYGRSHLLVKPWVRYYPTSAVQLMSWKDVVIEPRD